MFLMMEMRFVEVFRADSSAENIYMTMICHITISSTIHTPGYCFPPISLQYCLAISIFNLRTEGLGECWSYS